MGLAGSRGREVIQRGIEAPRRLWSARTDVRLLTIVLVVGASVALDCAAQSNGHRPKLPARLPPP